MTERLLSVAVERGYLSVAQSEQVRRAAHVTRRRVDQIVLDSGLVSTDQLWELATTGLGMRPILDLPDASRFCPDLLPARFIEEARLMPLTGPAPGMLEIAMLEPFNDLAAQAIRLKTGLEVIRRPTREPLLDQMLESQLGPGFRTGRVERGSAQAETADLDHFLVDAADAPAVQFIRGALTEARECGASDIHLTLGPGGAHMAFRIGGDLVARTAPRTEIFPQIVSRLKVLANLDIAQQRLPQDGGIRVRVAGVPLDVRVATMPHLHGEGVVLRLLGREMGSSSIGDLGFSPDLIAKLRHVLEARDGLILVTGPTGSGKSTTLHAALREIQRPDLNIVTVEDPVEYRVDAITQIQIDEKAGLSFPVALRSLLRQDPDIILVGEIRDSETARIAVQASLTGHLVLATLHTNSALGAVPRLIDMGIEPYLLAAVMRGVLSQRLVKAPGASAARLAIGELVVLSENLVRTLATGADAEQVRHELERQRFVSLIEDAQRRVDRGELEARDVAAVIHDE